MPVAIRNIEQKDFPALWKMDWSPLIKERDSIYLIIAVDQSPVSFVAYDEESPEDWMGVLLATRSADCKSCYINHLLVMQEARGKGVGSSLVRKLIEEGRRLGIEKIWFFTREDNRKFYEGLGFKEDYSIFDGVIDRYVRDVKHMLAMWRVI
jgi:ribosomal protein S18 acetylase RimI-like enzyme